MRPNPAAAVDAGHVDALVAALTLDEKASLTVGRDFFNTQDVPRLAIPAVWLADGPNELAVMGLIPEAEVDALVAAAARGATAPPNGAGGSAVARS